MDVYRTEEEQIDAIKKWWSENGSSVLMGVGLAVVLLAGWNFWRNSVEQTSIEASNAYKEVLDAFQVTQQQDATAEELSTLNHVGESLKEDFSDSAYAQLGTLLLAKSAVEQNKLEQAQSHLQWVLDKQPSKPIRITAKMRLARVLTAQKQYDKALRLLQGETLAGYEVPLNELKGDIHYAQGDLEQARNNYQAAVNAARENDERVPPLLDMKLKNLAQPETL